MDKSEESANRIQHELKRLLELTPSVRAAIRANEVLLLVAEQIATIQRSAQYVEQLDVLRDVANKLVEVRDLDQLARHILEAANRLIPFTDGAIGLVDEGMITFPYAIGDSAESVMNFKISVGVGLTGSAVKHKQPVRIEDTRKDKRYRDQIKSTRSELDVPIIYGGESIGVINIESVHPNAFSEDHERLLTALADHAAIAVKNAQLFKQMNALVDISRQLSTTLDFKAVIERILEIVSELIKSPEVSVGILDAETDTLRFVFARGPSKDEVLQYVTGTDQGLAGWAVSTKQPVRVGDVSRDPRYQTQIAGTRSELDVPLLIGDEVIGVLNAESPNINAFSEQDEYLLVAVANHAALALRNARLYEEIREELERSYQQQTALDTMAHIGDVAGNLMHRMNNDVGAIRVRANQIGNLAENTSIRNKARTIEELANRVLGQFRDFRERYKEVESSPLDINQIILSAVQEVPVSTDVAVVKELGKNLAQCFGAEVHLREVFRNLVANAVEAMPEGGKLLIRTQQRGERIVVKVVDSGSGISDEDLPHIFGLGFSTKTGGKGLGYGLFWVKTYLNKIGAKIEVEKTKPSFGSTFTVTLPVYETQIGRS